MRRNQTARKPRAAKAAPVKAPTPPAQAPTPPSEPEKAPVVDSAPAPTITPEGVKVECIIHNVHLGDGRQLANGERAFCPQHIAALLIANKQAVYV